MAQHSNCPWTATVSLLSGQITAATTEDLRDANKALKFSKVNNDVGLQFRPLGQISDMVLVAMSDAPWGIRREGHSQGGYLLMLAPTEILDGNFGLEKVSFAQGIPKLFERWLSSMHSCNG